MSLADVPGDRPQIIIGDTELPAAYRRGYNQPDVTYDNPPLPPHPGPAM